MKTNSSLFTMLLLTFLLISACNLKSEEQEIHELLKFNISLEHIEPDLNMKVESAKVIVLETKTDGIINGINKLYKDENKFIIFDYRAKQVLVFDTLGNHLTTIKRVGRGPAEYMFLTDIVYDDNKKRVGLLRQENGDIHWFDIEGSFHSTDRIEREKFILQYASLINGHLFHFVSNPKTDPKHSQVNITKLHDNKVINSLFKTDTREISKGDFFHPFGIFNNQITIHLPYMQEIYTIVPGLSQPSKLLEIHFQENNIPENLKKEFLSERSYGSDSDMVELQNKIKNYALVNKFIPLNKKFYFQFLYQHQPHGLIVDMEKKESYVFKTFFNGVPIANLIGYNSKDGKVYFAIKPAFALKMDFSDSRISKQNPELFNALLDHGMPLANQNPFILELQLARP
jgi:hypothetical protein